MRARDALLRRVEAADFARPRVEPLDFEPLDFEPLDFAALDAALDLEPLALAALDLELPAFAALDLERLVLAPLDAALDPFDAAVFDREPPDPPALLCALRDDGLLVLAIRIPPIEDFSPRWGTHLYTH